MPTPQVRSENSVDAVVSIVAGQMASRLSVVGKMPVKVLEESAVRFAAYVPTSRGHYEKTTDFHVAAAIKQLSDRGHLAVENGIATLTSLYRQSLQTDGEY